MIIHLMGGLGNQMFQVALGRQLAKALGSKLEFTRFAVDADEKRSYSMGPFAVSKHIKFVPEPPRFIPRFNEEKFQYYKTVWNPQNHNAYFIGHWQTEKYFKDRDLVWNDFLIEEIKSEANVRMSDEILAAGEKSAFIHIRRTDYLDPINVTYHGGCSQAYYTKAISHIRERVEGAKFFVFSDDIPWCEQTFSKDFTFVNINSMGDRNHPGTEHLDIWLMSQCKNSIIANSSFSWWGSWLGQHQKGGIRIAPEKWFRINHLTYQDVVPESWVKINND